MLIENTDNIVDCGSCYGATAKIIKYLPNEHYLIHVEVVDVSNTISSYYKDAKDENGMKKYYISCDHITHPEHDVVATKLEAEYILKYPSFAHGFYESDWVHITYHIYDDHFEVDARPIETFLEYIRFLESCNNCPWVHPIDKDKTYLYATNYRLVYYASDKHQVIEQLEFGVTDIDSIHDMHYDEIPELYKPLKQPEYTEVTRITVHRLSGVSYDLLDQEDNEE